MAKIAIITGISGQDGTYLSKLLIKKKYKVIGITNPKNKSIIKPAKIKIEKIDINNFKKISNLIKRIKPDEFYHLAAQSFINYKFEDEFFKLNPNINGTHYILSAIKKYSPKTKFYFAASSEIFGDSEKYPQNENNEFKILISIPSTVFLRVMNSSDLPTFNVVLSTTIEKNSEVHRLL